MVESTQHKKELCMVRKLVLLLIVMSFSIASAASVSAAAQPGITGTVFNKRFLPKIKPMMTYDQIVQIIGTQGVVVGEKKAGSVPVTTYGWKGGKNSSLNVMVSNRKIIEARMHAPNGHTYHIGRSGEIKDLGD